MRVEKVYLRAGKGYESLTLTVESEFKSTGLRPVDDPRESDVVVVVGRDRDILGFLQERGELRQPVLGVDALGGSSFLAEVHASDALAAAKKLRDGEFRVEKRSRLSVVVDEKLRAYALNEVAVFASKSALLLEYSLTVDKQVVWRDYSDGVIIATPTGSTAYALSAGGPVLHKNLDAFVIVPVSSMDISRRPLVVPARSRIIVDEVSRVCDVVVDGVRRLKLRRRLGLGRGPPAYFVRLNQVEVLALEKRLRITRELEKLPPSAKLIYKLLEYEGPMGLQDVRRKSLLPDRTVRMALGHLIRAGLVKVRTSLRDARRRIYYV